LLYQGLQCKIDIQEDFALKKIIITQLIVYALFTLLNMQQASASADSPPRGDEWKNLWYVNTIWYQIFPDRFYNGSSSNDPTLSERYDKKGLPVAQPVAAWDRDRPTTTNKFGGDLQGIREKLPYLTSLGIGGIWLNPIFAATSNHRYNTMDYGRLDPALGTEKDLRLLVDSAHQGGMRLILDGVFNHTGYEFWAFQDVVKKGEHSPYRDWYIIKSYPVRKLWEQSRKNPANYECWWGVGSLPKLNYENQAVRNHIFDITRKWMALGIDGWRLDVPEEIKCDEFWSSWRSVVKAQKEDAYLTGEIWGEGRSWVNKGDRFDGLMNYYGFRDPVLAYFSGRTMKLSEFDRTLTERRSIYPHSVNCSMQNLLSSHDTARILSVLYNKDSKDSDKEKKGYYAGPVDLETLKRFRTLIFFQMTYVGCPLIYYGDEIGMTGAKDPDCRRPMIWHPEKQNRELFEWYRHLIAIRKNHPALRTGQFATLLADDEKDLYVFERSDSSEKLIVAFNYSAQERKGSVAMEKGAVAHELISKESLPLTGKKLEIVLPAYGGKIFRIEEEGQGK
jgi:cyclomaltodextrinase / maltogenic alpha-amylase / neopullulanase